MGKRWLMRWAKEFGGEERSTRNIATTLDDDWNAL